MPNPTNHTKMQPQRIGKQNKPRSSIGKYAPYIAGGLGLAANLYPSAVAAYALHQIGKKK
jgi:hypothetical protein